MFSSLASYLFGSNNSAIEKSETTAETILSGETNNPDSINSVDADNIIEVTSLTPSVTGASGRGQLQQQRTAIKRGGKNKRNNTRQQNKRKGITTKNGGDSKSKLLTPSDSCDEDFDEDDWYIVEKEDDDETEENSPSRSDSERENTPVNEIVKSVNKPTALTTSSLAQQRRLQHINSHSLYSGPRPQKQRNYLQKTRGNTNSRSNGLSVSTLSPSRTVNDGRNASGLAAPADVGVTRSLYVASASAPKQQQQPEMIMPVTAATMGNVNGNSNNKMDESWFVTPPPCFTSIGPINMETSPYENLLIEHPSMSVYHSIKSAQEATESFIKLDISVNEKLAEKRQAKESQRKSTQAVQQRTSSGYRLDRQSVAQLQQELLARTVQKTQSKMDRKDICRSAIKRANKVRDVQSKNHIKRRSDRQYCKIVSNSNNNRKSASCY